MNQEMGGQRKVYHYLHDGASGAVKAEWRDDRLVFVLPNQIVSTFDIDSRDQRTVVVFDEHIPWGGLPKNGKVFLKVTYGDIRVSAENMRKPNFHEEQPLCNIYKNGKNEAILCIYRYFLLLPKSVSCVLRYDNHSLRPIYTFVEVNEKGVTWRTSSY